MIILEFSLLAAIHFYVNFLGDINIKNPPVDKSVILMHFFSKLCFETCKENLHADHSLRSQRVNFTETTFYS